MQQHLPLHCCLISTLYITISKYLYLKESKLFCFWFWLILFLNNKFLLANMLLGRGLRFVFLKYIEKMHSVLADKVFHRRF